LSRLLRGATLVLYASVRKRKPSFRRPGFYRLTGCRS